MISIGSQGIVGCVCVEIEMRNECCWELLRGLRRNRFFTSEGENAIDCAVRV